MPLCSPGPSPPSWVRLYFRRVPFSVGLFPVFAASARHASRVAPLFLVHFFPAGPCFVLAQFSCSVCSVSLPPCCGLLAVQLASVLSFRLVGSRRWRGPPERGDCGGQFAAATCVGGRICWLVFILFLSVRLLGWRFSIWGFSVGGL